MLRLPRKVFTEGGDFDPLRSRYVRILHVVQQLSPGYRSIFVLHDVQGYEHNEIAAIMKCSIGNSKSQLHKARMRLRELLHEAERSRAREERQEQQERQAAKGGSAGGG